MSENTKNYVYVYHIIDNCDDEEIKVFSSLEKAIEYANSMAIYEDEEDLIIEQDKCNKNRWTCNIDGYIDEILKIEVV